MRQMLIAAGCLIATMPLGWMAANTASSLAKGKEPRFPQLTLEQLNDQQLDPGNRGRVQRLCGGAEGFELMAIAAK
jgi:hypothetical protein